MNEKTIRPNEIEHIVVYRKDDEYAGWPFNGGFWQFGNGELLVGFIRNKCRYRSPEDVSHSRIQLGNGQLVMIRSKDNGQTWPIEDLKVIIKSKAELRAKILHYPLENNLLPKLNPPTSRIRTLH